MPRPDGRARSSGLLDAAIASGSLMLPDYGGACLSELVPAILRRREEPDHSAGPPPAWLPEVVREANQVVLLVLDGLGFDQLALNRSSAPVISSMPGAPITSVAPTTTATALTSIATGLAPFEHGVVGYRICVHGNEVLNVLRWTIARRDARELVQPSSVQSHAPFFGLRPPVVSRTEFEGTGFTDAHLPGSLLSGWRMPSSIAVEVRHLLAQGESFVYAYYDGIDKVAHERGLGEHYRAELQAADRLVEDLASGLPSGACLVVTADHGQVDVLEPPIELPKEVLDSVALMSGEGRFRWLHVVDGAADDVADACEELLGDVAVVASREDLVETGIYGGPLSAEMASRLGDVALVATGAVAFFDPEDTGEMKLVARHGAMTRAELLVPLLAVAP